MVKPKGATEPGGVDLVGVLVYEATRACEKAGGKKTKLACLRGFAEAERYLTYRSAYDRSAARAEAIKALNPE